MRGRSRLPSPEFVPRAPGEAWGRGVGKEQQGSRKVLESCLPRWNVAATRKTDKPYCELSRTGDSRGQGPPEWGRGPALPSGAWANDRWPGRPSHGVLVHGSKPIAVAGLGRDSDRCGSATSPVPLLPVSRLRGGGGSPSTGEPESPCPVTRQQTALYRSSSRRCGRRPRVWST